MIAGKDYFVYFYRVLGYVLTSSVHSNPSRDLLEALGRSLIHGIKAKGMFSAFSFQSLANFCHRPSCENLAAGQTAPDHGDLMQTLFSEHLSC